MRYLTYLLALTFALNLVLAADILRMRRAIERGAIGEVAEIASGVRVDGTPWRSSVAQCHVVRITKDSCPYCRSDMHSYKVFRDAAKQASCEILEVAPAAGEMREDAREGVVQLKYVGTDIGPSLFPLATPTTLVLDNNWTIRWMRRGSFTASTLNEGLRALEEVSR